MCALLPSQELNLYLLRIAFYGAVVFLKGSLPAEQPRGAPGEQSSSRAELLPQAGVGAAQVEQGDVEQRPGHVLGPDLGVLGDGVGLRQLPARADVDDGPDDGLALLVHEGERGALVGDGQGELVLIHQADLLDLRGVVDVVEEHGLAQHPRALRRRHLHRGRADLGDTTETCCSTPG